MTPEQAHALACSFNAQCRLANQLQRKGRIMKTIIAGICLFLVAGLAFATSVQADAPPGATQCGFYLDSATTATVVSVSGGTCKLLLSASLPAGDHTVTADARVPAQPPWSSTVQISPKSAPFLFTKPATTGGNPPSNFTIVP